MGLALVKGLVELHNGQVSAHSRGIGTGTTFTIDLPLQTAQPALRSVPERVDGIKSGHARILVIEDNADAAESMRLLLSIEGYDVHIVHTGAEGISAAKTLQPAAILCDIGLPGMDGYQVVRQIRQDAALASTYVVALTGYGRNEDQQQAQEAGFDIHMTKPIDCDRLRQMLSTALSKA